MLSFSCVAVHTDVSVFYGHWRVTVNRAVKWTLL